MRTPITPSLSDFKKAAVMTAEQLLSSLASNASTGLAAAEAQARKARFGPNDIARKRKTALDVLVRQLTSPFIYLLAIAAAVAFATGEHFDAGMIILFTLLNTGLGFFQEFRAERAVEVLMKYWRQSTHVVRGGKTVIVDSAELVPGDIVRLQAGDKIPADIRFLSVTSVAVDESVLTGESNDVYKDAAQMAAEPAEYYAATNIGFSGTSMLTGEATAVVIATGKSAALGDIATLAAATKGTSAFEKEISGFSAFIMKLVLVTIAFMFVLNVMLKGFDRLQELLIFSIVLTVGIIPEALPVVSTISLSRGAVNLAKRKVVVKRLSAIDDLGSIEILCTDKTGTITKNELEVADVLSSDPDACFRHGLLASSFIGEKAKQQNNAFDVALWRHAGAKLQGEARHTTKLAELPFDPVRRRNSVLVAGNDGKATMIMRGSPDDVIPLCTNIPDAVAVGKEIVRQGSAGNRVIAVAAKDVPRSASLRDEEHGMQLLGLISFVDPLKPSALRAAKKAAALGVQIKIITGDSRDVAGAVAHKLNIVHDPTEVVTGAELEAMSDEERHAAVHQKHVFARMNPRQKFMVLGLLQERHAVGFLGEGFNDAPGLKMANVGLAVEGASDIAKESADVILLNRDLHVIFDGIEEGRRTSSNTIKYIKVTLASNFGNFYSVAIISLFVNYLPMLPLQILLLNLLSDFPMLTIATDSLDKSDLAEPKKYDARTIIIYTTILGLVSSLFDFTTFAVFRREGAAILQSSWFIISVLTEIVLVFSLRTAGRFWKAAPPSWPLAGMSLVAAVTAIAIPFLPIGSSVFQFVPPQPKHALMGLAIVAAYFLASETVKRWLLRATTVKPAKAAT